jgi:hypothetical protein
MTEKVYIYDVIIKGKPRNIKRKYKVRDKPVGRPIVGDLDKAREMLKNGSSLRLFLFLLYIFFGKKGVALVSLPTNTLFSWAF